MSGSLKTAIYLFRNDLRLHDNECWMLANKTADFVIPLYCFDPAHYKKTWHFGLPKTGAIRAKFLIETVNDLKTNLKTKNTDLVVKNENPVSALKSLGKSSIWRTQGGNFLVYDFWPPPPPPTLPINFYTCIS